MHDARLRAALRFGHAPRRRRGRHEHRACGRADAPHRQEVVHRRVAAAGPLVLVLVAVEPHLLDAHARPVGIELVGDEHGERRLHPLTDLRVLRGDRDRSVGADLDPGVGRELAVRRGRERLERAEREPGGEQHPATGDAGDAEEVAARDRLRGGHVASPQRWRAPVPPDEAAGVAVVSSAARWIA